MINANVNAKWLDLPKMTGGKGISGSPLPPTPRKNKLKLELRTQARALLLDVHIEHIEHVEHIDHIRQLVN